ncbi:hypothetical protein ACIRRA_44135 [Nocardia sp. NPDC101769]|uniref:hypothetical protein n=1 Tax=Nocardia sp. NPDC101769 TaxID=3364333 RepID=UPI00382405B1
MNRQVEGRVWVSRNVWRGRAPRSAVLYRHQGMLELGYRAEDLEEHAADGGQGIDALAVRLLGLRYPRRANPVATVPARR